MLFRSGISEGPEAMLERVCGPNVITIEGDVLPAERSDMGKQIVADNLTLGARFGNSAPEINGVPEDDGERAS